MADLKHSSKGAPCPLCKRTKDRDCRFNDEVVFCHTHIEGGDFAGYIYRGIKDIWGVYFPKKHKAHRPKGRKVFFYKSSKGSDCIKVTRIDDGKGSKSFSQSSLDLGRTQKVSDTAKKAVTLYRIDDPVNVAAISAGKTIFLVEGESCADELLALGIPATTSIGGAGKWRTYGHQNYGEALGGSNAKIIICPDRDQKGIHHAQDIFQDYPNASWLYADPASKDWNYPPDKGGLDIVDWIAELRGQGLDDEKIRNLIYQSIELKQREVHKRASTDTENDERYQAYLSQVKRISAIEDPIRKPYEMAQYAREFGISPRELEKAVTYLSAGESFLEQTNFSLEELLNWQFDTNQWVMPGFLPACETCLLAGLPKVGKSLLVYAIALSVVTGVPFLGEKPLERGKVLMVMTDESLRSVQFRLKRCGFTSELSERVRIMTRFHIKALHELESHLINFGPTLVIIDSLKSITRGSDISENSAEFADQIYTLKELLTKYESSGLLIHHSNKNKEMNGVAQVRGSTAISGACWGIYVMKAPKRKEGEEPPLERTIESSVRDGAETVYSVKLDPTNYSWELKAKTGQGNPEQQSAKAKILDFLEGNRGKFYEPFEVSELLDLNQNTVRSSLFRLVDTHGLTKRKSVTNSDAFVYGVSSLSTATVAANQSNVAKLQNDVADPPLQEALHPLPERPLQRPLATPSNSYPEGKSEEVSPLQRPMGKDLATPPVANQKTSVAKPQNPVAESQACSGDKVAPLNNHEFIDPETGELLL